MLGIIINIVLVVLILSVLVFIHELGHFIAAKMTNTKVTAFAVGMGPKVWSYTYGETEYMLNLLPIGGYVNIVGDGLDLGEEGNDKEKKKKEAEAEPERSFRNKPLWAKLWILSAGVIFNLITAMVMYQVLLGLDGYSFTIPNELADYKPAFGTVQEETYFKPQYANPIDDGGAKNAEWPERGFLFGYINSEGVEAEFDRADGFVDFVTSSVGTTQDIKICDYDSVDQEYFDCGVYSTTISEEGKVGISLYDNVFQTVVYEGATGVFRGAAHSVNVAKLSIKHIDNIFEEANESGDYSEAANTLAGPVGLYSIVEFMRQIGVVGILDLIANLSLTLFIMNLLPIPALDGGRIILSIAERLLGKYYSPKMEMWLVQVSFVLLLILMLAIIVKDIFLFNSLREFIGL